MKNGEKGRTTPTRQPLSNPSPRASGERRERCAAARKVRGARVRAPQDSCEAM